MEKMIKSQGDVATWLQQQRGDLSIAVAFWGRGAVEHLGLAGHKGHVRILLDLSSGASNPDVVRSLMELPNCQVRKVDRLHAKVWISPTALLIGSANASANGLGIEGFESTHWRELGVALHDPKLVAETQSWFDQFWAHGSSKVEDEDLHRAQLQWELRRKVRPLDSTGETLMDAVDKRPENFCDRGIFVVVVNKKLSATGKKEVDRLSRLAKEKLYAYENWGGENGIPTNATLLSFTYYDEKLAIDAPAIYATEGKRRYGKLQLVHARENILNHKPDPLAAWKKRFKALEKRHHELWNKGDLCIDLTKFLQLTGETE